jgi:phosphoglucomutase
MPHPLAGLPAQTEHLTDINALLAAYQEQPDAGIASQRISFGTSGHRGNAFARSFNDAHIAAVVQAIVEYRQQQNITGPLMLGKDTHALSTPAEQTALAVLAANGVPTWIQEANGYTPTPVISRAIIRYNRDHPEAPADGILLTPSHNPPQDGGIKYNPPGGGPADTDVTRWIEQRANQLLANGNRDVRRLSGEATAKHPVIKTVDFAAEYIADLAQVIDMAAIARAGLSIGVDPLGGAAVAYWTQIAEYYGLNLTVVNAAVDPQFAFMPLDHDGNIRMDCSSPFAMANLVALKSRFTIAWGNDADVDRHGIVTPTHGLLNPNHFLCVAIHYLLTHRPQWSVDAKIGKTLVSSSLIDAVAGELQRTVYEVPVGFKWFADGLLHGKLCFGGEESAGASLLQHDGQAWTTDKDGIALGLLAAEITAVTGKNPGQYYDDLTARFGQAHYQRIDSPMTEAQRAGFKRLTAAQVTAPTLAGEEIRSALTTAPGNGADIGGLKVVTDHGWFAARPSGTEAVFKLYAESLISAEHLQTIIREAQKIVAGALVA